MRTQKEFVDIWLDYWQVRESCVIQDDIEKLNSVDVPVVMLDDYLAKQKSCHLDQWNPQVMSYFEITDSMTGEVLAKTPIEPLVSFLRHPKYLCLDNTLKYRVDKDYMFPLMLSEIYPIVERTPRYAQKFLFDLGASLYSTGKGGASQEWFIQTYEARGILFDRILAWEVEIQTPTNIFDAMPLKIFARTSYYNIPASKDMNAKTNAFTVMKEICHVDDFIVMKIDIDNPDVEAEMIYTILNDRSVSILIDELYYEHHVSHSPMEKRGWAEGIYLQALYILCTFISYVILYYFCC